MTFIIRSLVSCEDCDCFIKKYYYKENDIYALRNFNTFKDLERDCNEKFEMSHYLEFIPSRPIIIDDKFQIEKIVNQKNIPFLYVINMIYFKGIDIGDIPVKLYQPLLYYTFSKLNAYSNNKLIEKSECNKDIFNHENNFFSSFMEISFIYTTYPEFLCPFLFSKSYLTSLYFTDISNSFINKNVLNILKANDTENYDVIINELVLEIKYESLTSKILNKYLFVTLYKLKMYGLLNNIEADIFSNFIYLKRIDLQVDNFKELFHRGNKWMRYLNSGINVDLNDQLDINKNIENFMVIRFKYKLNVSFINPIYEYPDEDFCLFQYFPHKHLVLPVLLPGKKLECSCTILWLIQYYSIYININYNQDYDENKNYHNYDLNEENIFYTISYCQNENFNTSLMKCNFTERLSKCSLFTMNASKENYDAYFYLNNDTDLLFLIKWLQFILIIILQPIFSFIGIVNNALIIIVINNKGTKKNFKDAMYQHIQINSFFNILYCLTMGSKILTECLFYDTSIYCSSFYQLESVQYFKIIFIYYFGNVFKYCKNFSFISFTVSRYILSLNKTKGLYKKFNTMNLKLYVLLIIVISCLLSLFRLFQYKVVSNADPTQDFPDEIYNNYYNSSDSYSYFVTFSVLKIMNFFINDIFIYLLNFIIDLILVKNINKHMKKKQKLVAKKTHADEEEKNNDNKAIKMTLISGLCYFISYTPEFLSTLFAICISKKNFPNFNFSTSLIDEETEVLGLISIISNFYILIIFNKIFKNNFFKVLDETSQKLRFYKKIF